MFVFTYCLSPCLYESLISVIQLIVLNSLLNENSCQLKTVKVFLVTITERFLLFSEHSATFRTSVDLHSVNETWKVKVIFCLKQVLLSPQYKSSSDRTLHVPLSAGVLKRCDKPIWRDCRLVAYRLPLTVITHHSSSLAVSLALDLFSLSLGFFMSIHPPISEFI